MSKVKSLLRWTIRIAVAGVSVTIVAAAAVWFTLAPDLPDIEVLREVRLQTPLRVESKNGALISVFGEKRRVPVTLDQVPARLQEAFIAAEDAYFYQHPGIDWRGISRAIWHILRTGDKGPGGSTLTQLVARNFFLTRDRTYTRKMKEILLALKIERELSKRDILELLLNKIYLGHRAYGVAAAAQVYYGRPLEQLELPEYAMLAALPKAPSAINPITDPRRARERRDYVLRRMFEEQYISAAEYQAALDTELSAFHHGPAVEVEAPYVAEMARRWAVGEFGADAYESGYRITTTIDPQRQSAANQALRAGLDAYDHRHGWRGPEAEVEFTADSTRQQWDEWLANYRTIAGHTPGLVTEADEAIALVYLKGGQTIPLDLAAMDWARPFRSRDRTGPAPEQVSDVLQPGDIVRVRRGATGTWELAQIPEVQGALISLEPDTGAIQALVGGWSFEQSKFNRVTQARRQPGSGFKPFIYATALAHGYTPASIVNDAPLVYQNEAVAESWKPHNFSQRFYGPTRLREGMVHSRNLVSVRLLADLGVGNARDYITRFGFRREALPDNLSMALGSASLTPLSIARGYAVFANGGFRVEPYWLQTVHDQRQRLLYARTRTQRCETCPALATPPRPLDSLSGSNHKPAARPRLKQQDQASSRIEVVEERPRALMGPPVPQYQPRAIKPAVAYMVRSMMEDVIRRGTGRRARSLGRDDLAGKTGTTNEQHDAWFSGYNSSLVTTVWVGFDDHQPLGRREVGGRAALPIWIDYMDTALKGVPERHPQMPVGVAQVWIDPDTGEIVSRERHPDAIRELVHAATLENATDGAQSGEDNTTVDPYE